MKEMPNKIEGHKIKIAFVVLSAAIILTTYLPVNVPMANASVNLSQFDMKSITDDINKSLTELTGGNSSDLLKNTIASINNTASQLANESKSVINENSLNTAEIIAGKIGIGIADVLGNISGEVKQGIESK
jgi:hypothetical protein